MTSARSANRRAPDFIGVGPEKTGTTWVYEQLGPHPQLWLPPQKELSYFWQDIDYANDTLLDRLTGSEWHHARFRRYAASRLKHFARYPRDIFRSSGRLRWDARYILRTHNDDWYLSCFDQAGDRLAGEISPQYFFLREPQIEKINRLCPDAKIIITLRNPADWIWSWGRMLVKKRGFSLGGQDLADFIERKLATNSFARSLERWRRIYPAQQVGVFFFEDLKSDPWNFYVELCKFLKIEPQPSVRARVAIKANPGNPAEIPDNLRTKILDGWREDITHLKETLDQVPEEWG